jgi:hypothetical protein
MATMLDDDGRGRGGRGCGGLITSLTNSRMQCPLENLIVTVLVKKFPAIVETNCFFLQPLILSLLNPLCSILS